MIAERGLGFIEQSLNGDQTRCGGGRCAACSIRAGYLLMYPVCTLSHRSVGMAPDSPPSEIQPLAQEQPFTQREVTNRPLSLAHSPPYSYVTPPLPPFQSHSVCRSIYLALPVAPSQLYLWCSRFVYCCHFSDATCHADSTLPLSA